MQTHAEPVEVPENREPTGEHNEGADRSKKDAVKATVKDISKMQRGVTLPMIADDDQVQVAEGLGTETDQDETTVVMLDHGSDGKKEEGEQHEEELGHADVPVTVVKPVKKAGKENPNESLGQKLAKLLQEWIDSHHKDKSKPVTQEEREAAMAAVQGNAGKKDVQTKKEEVQQEELDLQEDQIAAAADQKKDSNDATDAVVPATAAAVEHVEAEVENGKGAATTVLARSQTDADARDSAQLETTKA